ncbi:hypothetical protein DL93DRAFT_2167312 [Clavulina sp. PMI_390]|nr:hypothetical protein DL93DRAFT_2167312 [Clavulina sp. PMI_390]
MFSLQYITAFLSLLSLPSLTLAQSYTLKTNYQGQDFITGNLWNYSTAVDRNYGNAQFMDQSVATSQKLVYTTESNTVIVKVDNTTTGSPLDPNYGRASVYLQSYETLGVGSLILFDAVHVPYGCSVWPAFFTLGPGSWPMGGEIDIFENVGVYRKVVALEFTDYQAFISKVNLATLNQYSLHTYPAGCTLGSGTESGKIVSTDCYNNTNGNQGCIVQETKPNSFGSSFNSNGGGGYAALLDNTGIKIWWFPRASLPSDWTSNSPNPASWSSPSAFYPSSSCDLNKFFGPQQMILEIDICGAFAGDNGDFKDTCSGSCLDLVRTPTNYDQAYFEINFIKTFTASGTGSSSTTTQTQTGKPSSTNSLGAGAPTGTTTTTTTKSAAHVTLPISWARMVVTTAFAMMGLGLTAVIV